jgi:hypothetical protein
VLDDGTPRECYGRLVRPGQQFGNFGATLDSKWAVISPDDDGGLEGYFFPARSPLGRKILVECSGTSVWARCRVHGTVKSIRGAIGNAPGEPPVHVLVKVHFGGG